MRKNNILLVCMITRTLSTWYVRAQELLGGKVILRLLIVGFFVHFGYALFYRIEPSVDALRYVETAWNLVERGAYCLDCTVPLAADPAIHGVGPGYQFFLAGVFAIVGKAHWVIWALQSCLSLAIAAYVAYRTREHRSWVRNVLLAALVFHPDIIQSDAMLMTDTLFVALAVGATEAMLWLIKHQQELRMYTRWLAWLALGGGYALTNLVRPTGLPMLVLAIVGLAWVRASWKWIIMVLLGFALMQAPWVVRNHQVYGRWMLNSAVGNINLWVGLHPNGDGRYDLATMPDVLEAAKRLSAADMEVYSGEQAKKLLRERPVQSALRMVRKGFTLFSLTKTSGYWFHYRGKVDQAMTAALSLLANMLLLIVGLAGLFFEALQSWKKRRFDAELVTRGGMILACVAAPVLTVVAYRYRLPLLPSLTIFAVIYALRSPKTREWWLSLALSGGLVGVGTLLDVLTQWEKIVTRLSAMFS